MKNSTWVGFEKFSWRTCIRLYTMYLPTPGLIQKTVLGRCKNGFRKFLKTLSGRSRNGLRPYWYHSNFVSKCVLMFWTFVFLNMYAFLGNFTIMSGLDLFALNNSYWSFFLMLPCIMPVKSFILYLFYFLNIYFIFKICSYIWYSIYLQSSG